MTLKAPNKGFFLSLKYLNFQKIKTLFFSKISACIYVLDVIQ